MSSGTSATFSEVVQLKSGAELDKIPSCWVYFSLNGENQAKGFTQLFRADDAEHTGFYSCAEYQDACHWTTKYKVLPPIGIFCLADAGYKAYGGNDDIEVQWRMPVTGPDKYRVAVKPGTSANVKCDEEDGKPGKV